MAQDLGSPLTGVHHHTETSPDATDFVPSRNEALETRLMASADSSRILESMSVERVPAVFAPASPASKPGNPPISTLAAGDPDDTFAEALTQHDLGPLDAQAVTHGDAIDNPNDVDMFAFRVGPRETVHFDIDTTTNGPPGLGSYLRVFDARGTELASNNDRQAPGDPAPGFDSYIPYTFSQGGRYFVGVSNWQHYRYDPISGTDGLNPDPRWLTGGYSLVITTTGDPDDQIAIGEATAIDPLALTWSESDRIDAIDVDMYSFTAEAGQIVAFDIDSAVGPGYGGQFHGTLRIFDSAGRQLALNSNGVGPREAAAEDEGYLEHTFPVAGTYFVGVSGTGNNTYDARTGEGDAVAAEGSYTLTITKVWTGP